MISDVRNIDCMDFMREFPNKYFELAMVEPAFIKKRTIIKVKESRPAMGDWSGKSYLGMKPFYNLVEATL